MATLLMWTWDNNRPISITSTTFKIFEKSVIKQPYAYIVKFKLLLSPQSGFRSGHVCHTALNKLIDEWLNEIDKGHLPCALILDFRNAFEIVNHIISLSKLKLYHCDDQDFDLFKSYLFGRFQKVMINNIKSLFREVPSGVI